jgi:hypothetical protein
MGAAKGSVELQATCPKSRASATPARMRGSLEMGARRPDIT